MLSIVDLFDSDSDLCSSNHLLRVKSIWTVLRVMEEANALQFNWKTSLARVHTLDALKVDEVIFVLFYPTSIEVQYLFDF